MRNFDFLTLGLGVPPKILKIFLGFRRNFGKSGVFSTPPSSVSVLGGFEKTLLFLKLKRNPKQSFLNLGGTPNPEVIKVRICPQYCGSDAN